MNGLASVNYVLQERLEREKKEKQKLKEKERKQRRRMEGKPVTKKEREAESRRQIQLAALQEQGNCVMHYYFQLLPSTLTRHDCARKGARREEEEGGVW